MSDHVLHQAFERLYARLGPQGWWPGDSPWEIACGAVLTQNTNWINVEKAIVNLFSADAMDPAVVVDMDPSDLAELIRPAGYFNLKAKRLRNLARWWIEHNPPEGVADTATGELRQELLTVNGVGEETADSILLYAFGRLSFVVDAYTRRFASRHGWIDPEASYGEIKAAFESSLPARPSLYNDYHALIVELGKTWCRPKPNCAGCPLEILQHERCIPTATDR